MPAQDRACGLNKVEVAPVEREHREAVKVWDGVVRSFHWLLLCSFALAWWTSQSGMQQSHEWIGYFLALLLATRLFWGVMGPRYARFGSFIYSPAVTLSYLKSILVGHPDRYLGHNPAGGWMVVAILCALLVTVVSGFIVEAVIEFEGPLVTVLQGLSDQDAYLFLDLHELMLNIFWVLISLHVVGVVLASVQHRENLVRAMVTGFKSRR